MATTIEPVKARLKARAYEALSQFTEPPAGRVTVRARNRLAVVTLTLQSRERADASEVTDGKFPGLFFSPLEAAVWNALSGEPLNSKALARACAQKYSPKFRTLLHNLIERHVLHLDRTSGGYRRAAS